MPDVREARRRFSLVLAVLLCIDLAAAGVLVSPIGRSSHSGQEQLRDLQTQLNTRTREVVPLRGLDQKIVDAKAEIDAFYQRRFPSSYSSIAEELWKLANANGVKIATGRYQPADAEVPGVAQLMIDASISGPYPNIVKFINSVERDPMFLLIDSVDLGQQQGGIVRLQVKLETYLKE